MVESYMHRNAKEIVASWLTLGHTGPIPEHECVKVHQEYPVSMRNFDRNPESNHQSTLNVSWHKLGYEAIPTFEQCCAIGLPPKAIVDVAIEDNDGIIRNVVEIVHKHDLTPEKIWMISSGSLFFTTVWRVPASWVMHQVGVPTTYQFERVNPTPLEVFKR